MPGVFPVSLLLLLSYNTPAFRYQLSLLKTPDARNLAHTHVLACFIIVVVVSLSIIYRYVEFVSSKFVTLVSKYICTRISLR